MMDKIYGETCIETYPGHIPPEFLRPEHRIAITPWTPNIFVDRGYVLLGALLGGSARTSGIQYVATGSGHQDWDTQGLPEPDRTLTQLVNELGRIPVSLGNGIKFLTDTNQDSPSNAPTNRLEISATFGSADGNGQWREWGLVGGNADGTPPTEYLIDYQTHAIVTKEVGDTRIRRIRLYL